jgi:hypothetical protein
MAMSLSVLSLRPTSAQLTPEQKRAIISAPLTSAQKQEITSTLATSIKTAIAKHSQVPGIRQKVLTRVIQCSLIYGVLLEHVSEIEAKNALADASEVTRQVFLQLVEGMPMEDFERIVDAAGQLVVKMDWNDKKQKVLLLRNCKSFNETSEVDDAVSELTY